MENNIRNVNLEIKDSRTKLETICYKVNQWIGSPVALISVIVVQFIWIIVGEATHLDSYPFPFLLTVSNILQLVLIFALALGQRQTNNRAELRAEIDHETITKVLKTHKEQTKLLNEILNKLSN